MVILFNRSDEQIWFAYFEDGLRPFVSLEKDIDLVDPEENYLYNEFTSS